jgi:ATP-dependent helicase/nuclease subunit B
LDSAAGDYNFANIFAALEYNNEAKLGEETAQKLFPAAISSSATKLRTFASCPYQYFAKYILKLKERRIFDLKPVDWGKFYHSVLEKLFYKLKSAGLSLADVQISTLQQYVDQCVGEILIKDVFLKTFKSKSRNNAYMIESASEIVKDAVAEYAQIARAGCFVQAACETAFGADANLPAVEVELSADRKLCIAGKIDRIDIAQKDGKNYAVVFDYKTSQAKVDYSLLLAGIDLQLPIYMLAAAGRTVDKFDELVPLGGFYMPIKTYSETSESEDIEKISHKIFRKPKGLFNSEFYKLIDPCEQGGASRFYNFFIKKDGQIGRYETSSLLWNEDFEKLLPILKNKIKEIGQQIASGAIAIKPYKCGKQIPCTNCEYKPVCRFDWQINDYAEITKITKTEFFQK